MRSDGSEDRGGEGNQRNRQGAEEEARRRPRRLLQTDISLTLALPRPSSAGSETRDYRVQSRREKDFFRKWPIPETSVRIED